MTPAQEEALLSSAFGFALLNELPSADALLSPEQHFLYRALVLASNGLGRTQPNPPVGAVIVKEGVVVGEGFHERAGLAHAEVRALLQAGEKARGGTLYLSLEPCAHQGRTPPCTDAILASGLSEVVVATRDPNPLVNGRGLALLRQHGVETRISNDPFIAALAQRLITPFAVALQQKRPYIVLKMATSLDGMISHEAGTQSAITGSASNQLSHRLRDQCGAIALGRETVRIDNPRLTVREVPTRDGKQPLRIVFDSQLRLELDRAVFDAGRCTVVTADDVAPEREAAFLARGLEIVKVERGKQGLSIRHALERLCDRGVMSLLVEGGAQLWSSFINEGCVDEIWWLTAPVMIGAQGKAALGHLQEEAQTRVNNPILPRYRQAYADDQLTIMRIKAAAASKTQVG